MRFVKNIYAASILMATLCSSWSCSEDEGQLSEAVLASTSTLSFEAQETAEQMITVYADADWIAEIPEWVTVTPASGTGTMDVLISVSENMREGTPDIPRKAAIVFKGATLASRAEVLVLQNGNKYRDVKEYTVDELTALPNETIVSVVDVTVMAVTTQGYVVTNAQKTINAYVLNTSEVNVSVGDQVSIKGVKSTDTQNLVIVDSDNVEIGSTGGVVTYPEAKDITTLINNYTPSSREFIKVTGVLSGNNLRVADAKYSISVTDAPAELGLAALNGHRVTVTGYFAGLAKPVIRILATGFEDLGVVKVIYFAEDFAWLDSWVKASGAGKPVEKGPEGGKVVGAEYAPNIYTHESLGDPFQADVTAKGYELINSPGATSSIYIQDCYFKFGKGGVQAGIVLPPISNIPANTKLALDFDWAPFVGGSDKFDLVKILVTITNGDQVVELDPVGHSFVDVVDKLKWLHATLLIEGVTITKDTKITLKSEVWGDLGSKVYMRWFLDNIEISKVE